MKLPAWLKPPALTAVEWFAAAVAVLMVIIFAWWLITSPAREARLRAEHRVDDVTQQEQAKATNAAVAIAESATNTAAHNEELSREHERTIQAAPGADQRVDPAVNRALHDSLCQRAAYRNTPYCLR